MAAKLLGSTERLQNYKLITNLTNTPKFPHTLNSPNMKNSTQFSQAFTLLEVLIATSIFAVVMVMTTGVIAQSTGYQTKTKVLRDVSEEAGRISDAISRDLKTASGSFSVTDSSGTSRQFKNGLALTDATGKFITSSLTTPANISSSLDTTNYQASAVIINTKDSIRIYVSKISGIQNIIYAETCSKTAVDPCSLTAGGWWSGNMLSLESTTTSANLITTRITNASANIISSSSGIDALDTQAAFSGYTAVTGGQNVQSYITYFVHSQTKDFASLALTPTNRSEVYIRSMVTMRNYSN